MHGLVVMSSVRVLVHQAHTHFLSFHYRTNAPTEPPITPLPTLAEPILNIRSNYVKFDFEDGIIDLVFVNDGWVVSDGGYDNSDKAIKPIVSNPGSGEEATLSLTVSSNAGAQVSMRFNSNIVSGSTNIGEYIAVYNNGNSELMLPAETQGYELIVFVVEAGQSTIQLVYSAGESGIGNVFFDDISVSPYLEDDFDTGDFSRLPWMVSNGWVVDGTNPLDGFDSVYSAHFGPLDGMSVSEYRNLTLEVDTLNGATFTFATNPYVRMPYDVSDLHILPMFVCLFGCMVHFLTFSCIAIYSVLAYQ